MIAQWRQLAVRDRTALGALAVFALLAVGWWWVVQPVWQSGTRASAQLERSEREYIDLQRIVGDLSSGRVALPIDPLERAGKSLLALADASARDAGLGGSLKRVEPVGNGRVNLWFENVPFDVLSTWLEQLEARYGVRIDDLSADRAPGLGTVNARVGLVDTVTPP